MATNLSIDAELIEQALELSGEPTKKAAVTRHCRVHRAPAAKAWWSCSASSNGMRPTTTRPSARKSTEGGSRPHLVNRGITLR